MDESMYDRASVAYMAKELNDVDVRSLAKVEDVDAVLSRTQGSAPHHDILFFSVENSTDRA